MRAHGVPFRLHWGKVQPRYATGDRRWVDVFRDQYPRGDDFLALRAERDPNNIFLTGYWRARFGLWDAPVPRPITAWDPDRPFEGRSTVARNELRGKELTAVEVGAAVPARG